MMQPKTISALPQQHGFISIKKAIYIGMLWINLPVSILMVGIPFVTLFLTFKFNIPPLSILFGFIVGFILAWTWWSLTTPRWRIWAMLRVDNLYLLHKTAVKAQLTWPRDHLFEHTEIKTQLQDLQQKHIETRDLMNRFRYYIDYQIAIDNSRGKQFLELKRCLLDFCVAAYSENKKSYDAGKLKYLIDQLRFALKSLRTFSHSAEWKELIDLLIYRLDSYQESIKAQILR